MKETLSLYISGQVKLLKDGILILDHHNDIQTSAKDIIRRAIGSSSRRINKIIIYNNSTALASSSILINQVNYPTPNTVRFRATFPPESFEGNFNRLDLISDTGSSETEFSIISFDTLNKTLENSLVIDWILSIVLN